MNSLWEGLGPEGWTDIGEEHAIRFFGWHPDDLAANRERFGVPLPNVERAGVFVRHRKPDGSECCASIHFDLPETKAIESKDKWQVQSLDPLTVSPSLLCHCGDHGFIRDGKWDPRVNG